MRKTLIAATVLLAAVACSRTDLGAVPATDAGTTSPATSPSTASPAATTQVTLYYLVASPTRLWLAPERHRVQQTAAIAKAALEELVHGTPQDPHHSTPFPRAATINSVVIRDGLATVDWSADVLAPSAGSETEELGFQSIVYTLTEFSTIRRVRFTVEGKDRGAASNGRAIEDWWGHVGLSSQPWSRDTAIEVLEPVTLWMPLNATASEGAIRLDGEASTFEATVGIVLRDASGRVVVQTSATASEGAPGRGAFAKTVTFTPPASPETWTLQAIEHSPKDGSVTFMEDRLIRVG